MRGIRLGLGILAWFSTTAMGECSTYYDPSGQPVTVCSRSMSGNSGTPVFVYPKVGQTLFYSSGTPTGSIVSPPAPAPARVIASSPVLAAPSFDFMTQGAVNPQAQESAKHSLGWGVFTGATGITEENWYGNVDTQTNPDWARAERVEKDARLVRSYARMEERYVTTEGGRSDGSVRTVLKPGTISSTYGSQYGAVETESGSKVQLTDILVTDRGVDGKKTMMLRSTGGTFVEYEVGPGGTYKPMVSGDYKPTDQARLQHVEYLRHMGVFHDPKVSPNLAALAFQLPGDAGKIAVQADAKSGSLVIPNFTGVNDPRFVTEKGTTYLRKRDGTPDYAFAVSAEGHIEYNAGSGLREMGMPVFARNDGKFETVIPEKDLPAPGLATLGDRLKVEKAPDPPKESVKTPPKT